MKWSSEEVNWGVGGEWFRPGLQESLRTVSPSLCDNWYICIGKANTRTDPSTGDRKSMDAFNRYLWNVDYVRDTVLCSWDIQVNKANVPTLWSFMFFDKT